MRKLKLIASSCLTVLVLTVCGGAWFFLSAPPIQPLILAPELVDATSPEGRQLLASAEFKADYGQLIPEFVAQGRRAFCGVASSVTVINALVHPNPKLDQSSVFTAQASTVKGELAVSVSGLTLDQLADLIASHGLKATAAHAAGSTVEGFREIVKATLSETQDFLVVNYDRRVLKQEGAGHISPVAAYNATKDAVLVLDVAAQKYPFTWVPLPLLWNAMNTVDSDSGKTRGYVLVSR